MQIKKEIFLFCSLIVLSISLLIAADFSPKTSACPTQKSKTMQCCCEKTQPKIESKMESPWNFITSSLLHLSV